MGNYFKRVIYVGIQVKQEEFLKAMNFKDYDAWFDYADENGLNDLNGHEQTLGKFGSIYTDDEFICVGEIIDAYGESEREEWHVDLLQKLEEVKFRVSERLRKLGIKVGEPKIYVTTLCY